MADFGKEGYYCNPSSTNDVPDASRVYGFIIGRYGYGYIKFIDPVDIQLLVGKKLDEIVEFSKLNVALYANEVAPPRGTGLNLRAKIVFENISVPRDYTRQTYTKQLKREINRSLHMSFIDYNEEAQTLALSVQYFV